MIVRYSPIVAPEVKIDVNYLTTIVPVHVKKEFDWTSYCADIFVWVLEEKSHANALESLGMQGEEFIAPDRLDGDRLNDFDRR